MRSESSMHLSARVLIVESDRGLSGLYADVISTHCPGVRLDVCGLSDHAELHDNLGGADVVVCSCGDGEGNRFDALREVLTERACATVLVLVPADMPGLADEAMRCGASDVLLRAPGYLEQLAAAVRKNVVKSRAMFAADARAVELRREGAAMRREIAALREELAEMAMRNAKSMGYATGSLPLPVITRPVDMAKAA